MNAIMALAHFCEAHGPRVLMCTQAMHGGLRDGLELQDVGEPSLFSFDQSSCYSSARSDQATDSKGDPENPVRSSHMSSDDCESCQWSEEGQGFVTHEGPVTFISTHTPREQEVFSFLRRACVRSLSCEVCPGREGPLFFGDAESGYVFSYAFFLRDTKARGSQRWYSVVFLMTDHIHLINSWPFLVKFSRALIVELQSMAATVAETVSMAPAEALLRGHFSVRPDQFRRNTGSKIARSLPDLCRQPKLFHQLHGYFVWMLRNCTTRMFERQIEGPSLVGGAASIPLQLPALPSGPPLPSETPMPHAEAEPLFFTLRQLHDALDRPSFAFLVHNIIIGNQCIVQGDQLQTVQSIMAALSKIVPEGCCTVRTGEPQHLEIFHCNFLGLTMDAEVPEHVLSDPSYVLLRVGVKPASGDDRTSLSSITGLHLSLHNQPGPVSSTFVARLMDWLASPVASSVDELWLAALREEWMTFTKSFFKFLKFFRLVPSPAQQRAFLQHMGLRSDDGEVLRFWAKALSRELRVKLLLNDAALA